MARARRDQGKSLEQIKKDAQARAEEEAEREEYEKRDGLPDGGWGWMVVLASFACNIIVDGVCYSFGVFIEQYMSEFNTSNEQTGWVGSLLAGFYLTVGPIVSVLAERYGSRKVTIAGAIIACAGFLLSTQASSIGMLIVTWGIIGGIGFGMIYLPAIVTVGHWFDKKRAFATGIAVCGTGVGAFIFPPLSHRLIQEYEWRGAHLIIAGVVLNCVVCGVIFRPLEKVVKVRRECYQSEVEIQRGAIMKALIEEKKRQRTISNGSLDNCVITRDNRLIKVDPLLLQQSNNSLYARMKRSLGFSSQSLNKSKTSLQNIPSFLVSSRSDNRMSPIYRPSSQVSAPPSPCHNKQPESVKSNSSDTSEDSGVVCVDGQAKPNAVAVPSTAQAAAKDEDSMSVNDVVSFLMQKDNATLTGITGTHGSTHSVNNPICLPGHLHPLDIVSVTEVTYSSSESVGPRGRRPHRFSEGGGSCYNNPTLSASSASSFVSRSLLSIPQGVSQYSIDTLADEVERRQRGGMFTEVLCVLKDMLDFHLLKNPLFFLLVIASILTLLAFFIPFFYIKEKAKEIGKGDDEGIFLLSVIGITNTIGRVISGWVADRPWINVIHLNNGALILAGIGTLLVGFCESYTLLCVYAAAFGFCVAVFVSLRSILLVELLGLELLTKSFGMLILFQGLSTMAGAPLAGRLLDTTQSVDGSFIFAGVLLFVSGVMGFPLWIMKRRQDASCAAVHCQVPLMPEREPVTETLKLETLENAAV